MLSVYTSVINWWDTALSRLLALQGQLACRAGKGDERKALLRLSMRCLRLVLHMLEHTSKSLRILEVCRLFCWECAADRSFLMALASSCSLPIDAPTCTTKHLSSDTLPIIKGRPLQNIVRNVTMMHHTIQAICTRLSSSAQNREELLI